ncbi:MAG TPA: hypothetical protein VJP60_01050 [Rhizomicrobium sp.]|nr:hypothetical protein [Rhizomicrobium sp.]
MRQAFCALLVLLGGCAPHLVPREGKVVPVDMPQAREQCRAQPALDWCHGR